MMKVTCSCLVRILNVSILNQIHNIASINGFHQYLPIVMSIDTIKFKFYSLLSNLLEDSDDASVHESIPFRQEPLQNEFAMDAKEDMEDVLTCVCCQDIMTNPICLEPCLHAFCEECYTSWEAIQRTW